jgi:hypothetical protein
VDANAALVQADAWLNEVLEEGTSGRVIFDDLAEAFMLLVPIHYTPGMPRVIKWAVDKPMDWYGDHPRGETLRQRVVTELALRDKVHAFDDIPIGLSESYHVEVVAPDDVLISDAVMVASQWSPTAEKQISSAVSVAKQHERAHLNVSMLASHDDSEKARGDSATVILTLRARRTGAFFGLCITSGLIALILAIVRLRVSYLESTNAAALLLVFPALVAAYLARPGEHILAARLLKGVRFLALVTAVCSIVATGMIAAGLLESRIQTLAPPAIHCAFSSTSSPGSSQRQKEVEAGGCKMTPATTRRTSASAWVLDALDALVVTAWICVIVLTIGYRSPTGLDKRLKARRDALVAPLLHDSGKNVQTP